MTNIEDEYFHDNPIEELPTKSLFTKGRLKIKLAALALI